MKSAFAFFFLLAAAWSRCVGAVLIPGAGSTIAADDLGHAQIVSDDELANNRGGFVWAGVDVSLGAQMRTYLNGELVLETNVSWTPTGAHKTETVSGALTPVDASTLARGLVNGAGISLHVGNESLYLANQGQTVLMQRAADSGLQNVLINRASGVQISQQVDATIDLHNFSQFQNAILAERVGTALGDMVGSAEIQTPR